MVITIGIRALSSFISMLYGWGVTLPTSKLELLIVEICPSEVISMFYGCGVARNSHIKNLFLNRW